jgi:hypothetical protein
MGTRRLTRWVRVGLVAIALAGLTAVPMIDSASAATFTGRNSWCQRCY